MSGTSTLTQFQRFVWESLPIRREAVGREVIDDVVLMAVQCWPIEELSQANGDSQQEVIVLRSVCNDIRRIMALVYGQDRFHGYWLVALRTLIPQMVDVMHDWWRRRKDNRAKMIMWRRKWVADG